MLKTTETLKNSLHEPNPPAFYYSQPMHSGEAWNDAQGLTVPAAKHHQPHCSCTVAQEEQFREKELTKATSCSLCMTAKGRTVVCQRYYTAQALETQPRDHN